jgi:hypothetical protein
LRDLFVLSTSIDDGIVRPRIAAEGGAMKQSKARKAASGIHDRGINLDVRGSALAEQAAERIAWHRQNAARIKEELNRIAADTSGETTPADWRHDARRTELTRLMLGHEEYARFLTFVKRHLKREQVYRLGFADLMALEITPKGSYT